MRESCATSLKGAGCRTGSSKEDKRRHLAAGLLPARMCFQTALSFRQRCERPVTIQLHVQQGGQLFSNLFSCALSSQSSSPGRAAQQPPPEKPNHRHPSCHRAVHLPQPPDIKKSRSDLRLFVSKRCKEAIRAGRASGHPCRCAGPSDGHISCSPQGPHARGHLPCWCAGTSRPRHGHIRATCHGSASLHR